MLTMIPLMVFLFCESHTSHGNNHNLVAPVTSDYSPRVCRYERSGWRLLGFEMPSNAIPIGSRFGRLVVIGEKTDRGRRHHYPCQCDCGKQSTPRSDGLKPGGIQSCGCLADERALKVNTTHGKTRTRLHRIWGAMKDRCGNPNNESYVNYGGRGIKVEPEFMDFKFFHQWSMQNGYSDVLTIDRIDNDGNYSSSNCRWVTRAVQLRNKRDNRNITYNGKTQCISAWAEELGIGKACLIHRVTRGWTVEMAMSSPVQKRQFRSQQV